MPEEQSTTPDIVKHCVVDVSQKEGKDVDSAFAICIDNYQENGYIKDDSLELTSKGEGLEKEKKNQDNHEDKIKEYENLLKTKRESLDLVGEINEIILKERSINGF